MSNQAKWLAAIAAAVVAFFAVWGYDVVVTPPDEEPPDTVIEPPDSTPPFTLSAEAHPDSVVLSWVNVPDSVEQFMALRSETGADASFAQFDSVPAPASGIVDRNVSPGDTWTYRARPRPGHPFSNDVTVDVPADTTTEPPEIGRAHV